MKKLILFILVLCVMLSFSACSLLQRVDQIFASTPVGTTATEAEPASTEAKPLSSEDVYVAIAPSVVEICTYNYYGEKLAIGSGFFINDKGLIVTNYHVIDSAYSAKAILFDGTEYEVKTINGYDEALDLATLSIDITGNQFLELEKSGCKTGEKVYAIGSSRGLTGTFSDGIVSANSRIEDGVKYIQTTAPISPGNSGGPLVNVYAKVIGVNTLTITNSQNLNFAVDVSQIYLLDRSVSMSVSDFWKQINSIPDYIVPDNTEESTGFSDDSKTNVYINEYLNLKVTLPKGWSFYSKEQIAEINNIASYLLDTDIEEIMKTVDTAIVMYLVSADATKTVNLTIQPNQAVLDAYTDAEIFQNLEEVFKAQYAAMGMEVKSYAVEKIEVFGEERDACHFVLAQNGIEVDEYQVWLREGKDYYGILTFGDTVGTDALEPIDGFARLH